MRRLLLAAVALASLAMMPGTADAKAKPKPAGTQLTQNDLRVCMGLDGSTPDEQIPVCTKIINSGKVKHPYEADYYATRGAAYFAKNDLDKAMADLNKAIAIRQAPEFYFQRGLVHRAKFEWDAAKSDLDKVMTLKPNFVPAFLVRGIVAYEMAEFQEALKYFDGAMQRSPTYYKALFARGVTKKKLGDADGGDKDIAAARSMSPKVDADLAAFGLKP